MTYCFGYKDGNGSVFLWADSAGTGTDRPMTQTSSFGELHTEARGGHVEESLLKLIPIAPWAVAAYAGDSQNAEKCLQTLRDNIHSFAGDDRALLRSLSMSVGRFPEGHGVSLLLATSSAQGGSSLLRWDSEHGLDPSDADRYWIGSLDSYHAEVAPSLVPVLSSGNIHPERLLVAVTSLIQSYGVHDNMIEKNVGGAVFGVLTRQGKLEWQGDTDYFLYSQDNTGGISINGFASVVQQDNAVGANSSYINEDRIFISSVSIPKEILRSIRENSWQGWASLISRGLSSVTKENVVFINSMERTITVIHRPNTVNEGNLVRLRYLGGGKYDVAFSQILAEILSKSAKYRQAGAIPFRVNYLTD